MARRCRPAGRHPQRLPAPQHGQRAGRDRGLVPADDAVTAPDMDERVEVRAPRQVDVAAGRDRGVDHRHRGVRRPGARVARNVAGDHPHQRATIARAEQRHLTGVQVLVARSDQLVALGQVDPQLETVEQATRDNQVLRRGLDVKDHAAGSHPLGVAVVDRASATDGRLVAEEPVVDVGKGL